MNYVVGKIGKSILFDSNKWGAIGGDNEAPIFFETLFDKNPNDTFYLLGYSDFSRLPYSEQKRINKNNNVIDLWANDFKEYLDNEYGDGVPDKKFVSYIEKKLKEEFASKIDAGIFVMGPTGSNNVCGKTHLATDHDKLASPLFMLCKYVAPTFHFLNESKIPYLVVLNDPRFFPSRMRDLFHRPKIVLSQYNETVKHISHNSYDDLSSKQIVDVKCDYSRVETLFLIGKEKGKVEKDSSLDSFFENDKPENTERDINFLIVCNEGLPSRYPDLKKYILNHIDDIEIYGKWDEKTIGDDKRFKGPKKFNDLQKILPRVKYTFCIPIKKGWVTSKFWEMIHYGIIPFLHPTYDEQNNLKCPEFLRVKDSTDLYKKIKFLEDNPNAYETLKTNLEKMLKDEYYDGSYINNLVMSKVRSIIKNEQ